MQNEKIKPKEEMPTPVRRPNKYRGNNFINGWK